MTTGWRVQGEAGGGWWVVVGERREGRAVENASFCRLESAKRGSADRQIPSSVRSEIIKARV
jgi:hypothetical protein